MKNYIVTAMFLSLLIFVSCNTSVETEGGIKTYTITKLGGQSINDFIESNDVCDYPISMTIEKFEGRIKGKVNFLRVGELSIERAYEDNNFTLFSDSLLKPYSNVTFYNVELTKIVVTGYYKCGGYDVSDDTIYSFLGIAQYLHK